MTLDIYRNIATWKKPLHQLRSQVAKLWLKMNPSVEVIGITGSVGKTTTKEAIFEVLSSKFRLVSSIDNLDPIFNIPITLLKIRPWTQKVVLEMGIEYPGEMDFYLSLVKPKIGVVTRIWWTHTEFLKNLDGVLEEKGKMVKTLPAVGRAILNWDDENVRLLAKKTKAKVFWFGSDSQKCDLWVKDFRESFSGSSFLLATGERKTVVSWKLLGKQNLTAALAASAVGLISGLSLDEVAWSLSKLIPQPGRLNIKSGVKESFVLDDTYNSNPMAVEAALETLVDLAGSRRKFAVLGDMLELGDIAESAHRQVGKFVADLKIDFLFTVGKNSKLTAQIAQKNSFGKNVFWFENLPELVDKLKKEIKKNDIVLIKGSRAMQMEKIVEKIAKID